MTIVFIINGIMKKLRPSLNKTLYLFFILTLFSSCQKINRKETEFFPRIIDGINRIDFSSFSNEWRFGGQWEAPRMGEDKRFYRQLENGTGTIRFQAVMKEKYIMTLEVQGASRHSSMKISRHSFPFSGERKYIPESALNIGDNTLSVNADGTLRLYKLALFPRRLIHFKDYKNLLNDEHICFFPGELVFQIKPKSKEILRIRLNLFGINQIELDIVITGERDRLSFRKKVKNNQSFVINPVRNQFQKITITPRKKRGYLRVMESFLEEIASQPTGNSYLQIKNASQNKNVLIVLLDAARYDHMGFSGYKTDTTPSVDSLASRSIVFSNTHSEASYTLASTATLLTGLPPDSHNVISKFYSSLSKDTVTLAELFKQKGYFTGAISANPNFGKSYNLDKGFSDYIELFEDHPAPLGKEFFAPFEDMLNKAGKKNFFIYLHIREPHDPFLMPPPYLGKFQSRYSIQSDALLKTGEAFHKSYTDKDDDLEFLRAIYDENLAYGDWAVGRLLEILKKRNLDHQTIQIFLSDHGEAIGEKGVIGHGHVLYQEGIRIPLAIHVPGINPDTNNLPAITSDLSKTLLDIFDLPFQYHTSSYARNLFSLKNERRLIARSINIKGYPLYTALHHPYKLIVRFPFNRENVQLFDLENDPHEKTRLKDRDLVKDSLLFYIFNHIKLSPKSQHQVLKPALRKSDLEALKTLGYID